MKKITLLLMMTLAFVNMAKADVEWTIWEGSATKTNVSLTPSDFKDIALGDILFVYATGNPSKELYKVTGDKWEWSSNLSAFSPTATGTDANYYYTIDSDLKDILEDSDLKAFVIGNYTDGATISKVSIKKWNSTSVIKTILKSTSCDMGNWANSYTIDAADKPTMSSGDFIHIPASRQTPPVTDSYDLIANATTYSTGVTYTGNTITFDSDGAKAGWTIDGSWLNANSAGGTVTVEFSSAIASAVDLKIEYQYVENDETKDETATATAEAGVTSVSVSIPTNSTYISHIYLLGNSGTEVTLSSAKASYSNSSPYYQTQLSYGNSWTWIYGGNSFSHDNWYKIASTTDATNLTENSLHVNGTFYNATGLNFYHPVPSFSIGSLGYATFSADQQVTVPNTVKAYKGTISGDKLVLTQFTDNVIPANTGAIIAGDEGSVLEFTGSVTSTSSEESALIACTTATDVTTLAESGYDLYVLYPGTTASETELPLSTLLGSFGNWNNDIEWNSTDYTVTYSKSTNNSEGGWVNKDWSNYDYLQLNFSSNTLDADATFYVAYYEHDDYTTQATLSQGATTVSIPLDATYKNCNGNFSMWSNATSGSLTFDSAALIDNDGATVAEFRKTTSGTLAANKAYLKIPASEARALSIVFDDEQGTTAIESVAPKAVAKDNIYYDLQGRRVAQPTRGLYIVNGKKVVIK